MTDHVDKLGNYKIGRGKSRPDGRGINKDSAKETTCNLVRPLCRVGGAEAGQTEGGTSESMICQTKEFEHYPQGNERHYLKGWKAVTRFHVRICLFLELTTMSIDFIVSPLDSEFPEGRDSVILV